MSEAKKTREREMFEDSLRQMQERLESVRDLANQLVTRAAEVGVILTIEAVPTPDKTPAMGEISLNIEARIAREVYKFLESLERNAIKSEQEPTQDAEPS